MDVKFSPRDTVVAADTLSNAKLISNGVRCIFAAIVVLAVTVILLSVFVFSLAVKAQERSQVIVYRSIQSNYSRYQKYARPEKARKEEHIEVVGDGYRFLTLRRGSRLCHWKLSTKTGHVRLRYHTFIVMQVPGLYNVYGQYAVYKPSREGNSTREVSVALMQNWTEVSTSMVKDCKHLCTASFSKTVNAQKGDHLSLQSGTGGIFFLNSKLTYFGVNKV